MKGRLFGDYIVEIDPRIATQDQEVWKLHIGGSWQGSHGWGDIPKAYRPDTLEFFYLRMCEIEHPTILDIGASTGSFCLLAKFHPGARVYAFEPYPLAHEILLHNIECNDLTDRVIAYQCALFNKTGVASLKVPKSLGGAGLACLGTPNRFCEWEKFLVYTWQLDDISTISHVDLIKIDVEGCELQVLQGGAKIINRFRPGILLEWEEQNAKQGGYKIAEIITLLDSWGYCYETCGGIDMWAWPKEWLGKCIQSSEIMRRDSDWVMTNITRLHRAHCPGGLNN